MDPLPQGHSKLCCVGWEGPVVHSEVRYDWIRYWINQIMLDFPEDPTACFCRARDGQSAGPTLVLWLSIDIHAGMESLSLSRVAKILILMGFADQ